jgi:dipeptidyl aminopeptidase/acylaminoacyl peptidase
MRKVLLALATAASLSSSGGAAAAPTPRMLVEVSDLSDVAISPDGAMAAFRREAASIERNRYDASWFVVPIGAAGPPRRIADGGEPLRSSQGGSIIEPPVWSADSQWIYYRAEFDGQVQVWRAARDGARAEPVTRDAADVESFVLAPDGASLLYTVGATRAAIARAETDAYDRGIRIDAKAWAGAGLFRSAIVNGRLATQQHTDDGFLAAGLLADQPKRQKLVDLASLAARDATPEERARFIALGPVQRLPVDPEAHSIRVSPSGAALAYLIPVADASSLIRRSALKMVADARATTPTGCAAAVCQAADIASLAWRPGRSEVVFTVNDAGRGLAQTLYGWDIASNRVRLIAQAEGLLNGGRAESGQTPCGVGVRFAVCVAAAANIPPRLERVDLETGARHVLYDPNPALHDDGAPPVTLLTWRDDKGHAFTGQYFAPVHDPAAHPAPLFITYYSCPGYLRGGAGDEWPLASLAAAGIAALCINHPFGWPFEATERYDIGLAAVRSVVDLLARRHLIDRTRVGMGGLSFGSEVTMWTVMHSNLLAAASVASPFASRTYYWLIALQGETQLDMVQKLWGLGAPSETPGRWKQLSPSFNLDQIKTPLLMQLPEQEYLVALDYFAPLTRSSTPVEMFAYPNEPHVKFLPRHKLAAYERNLDWFRFWLQGVVDPDPQKAEQYERWRAERRRAEAGVGSGPAPGSGRPGR